MLTSYQDKYAKHVSIPFQFLVNFKKTIQNYLHQIFDKFSVHTKLNTTINKIYFHCE